MPDCIAYAFILDGISVRTCSGLTWHCIFCFNVALKASMSDGVTDIRIKLWTADISRTQSHCLWLLTGLKDPLTFLVIC